MRLKAISLLLVLFSCPVVYGQDRALWDQYQADFISDDGRVIDYHQGLISHSEGQGYGLLLSQTFNDKKAFDRIWRWTRSNIKVRADNLFAWKWGKRPNNEWSVIDYNNATDGDILIAYALLKADEKWHDAGYMTEAQKIIRDVRSKLSVEWHGRTFLLPGYDGFNKNNGYIVNPSYLIFFAFRYFAKVDQPSFWEKIYKDGLFFIEQSSFGKWRLPADWLMLTEEGISIYEGRDPYFGSDAIRVLLYLSSEKTPRYPKGVGKVLDYYNRLGYVPLWTDLEKNSFSLQPAPAGYYAIYALVAKRLGDEALSIKLLSDAREKLKDEKRAYYSFSLYLLATSMDSEIFH